jgi:hypothetical protein
MASIIRSKEHSETDSESESECSESFFGAAENDEHPKDESCYQESPILDANTG